jgi:predicted ATPase
MNTCACAEAHETRRVVLTGGPGAGKTAVLEMVRNSLCRHVRVLPEAASIVFGGGFPREDDPTCRRAEQRAIYFVQRELEVAGGAHTPAVLLCDRGTLDGLAYWPGPVEDFWGSTHTTLAAELARYDLVVHLKTPRSSQGYNHQNPLRTEPASAAAQIDERISAVWNSIHVALSSRPPATSSTRPSLPWRYCEPSCRAAAPPTSTLLPWEPITVPVRRPSALVAGPQPGPVRDGAARAGAAASASRR